MSQTKSGIGPAAAERSPDERQEVTILLRDISDESWNAAIEGSANHLVRRFFEDGGPGADHDMGRKISTNIDRSVLVDSIGGEFTARLGREIEDRVALRLHMRYSRMEIAEPRRNRLLSFTIPSGDAAAIYDWNVDRAGLPSERIPAAASLSRWDWGQWLDSIVRAIDRDRQRSSRLYWEIFHGMWRDGFITKAMILALSNPSILLQELGVPNGAMH